MINTICKTCPGKMRITMKIDTGVKKAVAFRLKFLLEETIRSYYADNRNPFLLKCLTPTQQKARERRFRKSINALRIVITMCASEEQRQELPSWFAIIPADEPKEEDPPKNGKVVPKTKPRL